MQFGARIREEINNGIRSSVSALVFISEASLQSRWVLNELDAAMLREISNESHVVIPVLLGNFNDSLVPADLRGKKYLDLRGDDWIGSYSRSRAGLLVTLKTLANLDVHDSPSPGVLVGDALVGYFATYSFRNPARVANLRPFFHNMLSSLRSAGRDDSWQTQALVRFLDRYGIFIGEQILLQAAEEKDFDGNGFTEDELTGLAEDLRTIAIIFQFQSSEPNEKMEMFIKDGEMRFRRVV